jgi:DNA-binding response OmpR family regulator
MRILLVEDSERLAELIARAFRSLGHTVVTAGGVGEADIAASSQHFDVAVVDIGLPDGSGLAWCRAERGRGNDVPILMLTARGDVRSRVEGLDSGADDYVGKPFDIEELVARVRAIARRGPRVAESVRTFGKLTIDRERRTISSNGSRIALTARELDIVSLLAWRDGRVVTKDEILEAVWGEASESASASFEVLLARIRRKLDAQGVTGAIRTVRQVGYAWALDRSKPD